MSLRRSRAYRWRLAVAAGAGISALAAVPIAVPVAHASPAMGGSARSATAGQRVAADTQMVRSMADDLGVTRPEAVTRLRSQDGKDALADRLSRALGPRAAGAFVDTRTHDLVVNVTSSRAAQRVRSAGARARLVERSIPRLERVRSMLERNAVTGTTLAVDVRSNTVDVTVPASMTGARADGFVQRVRSFGDAVQVTRVPGSPRPQALYGGEAITGGGARCSTGFIAQGGGTEYVLTAGHCTGEISSWSSNDGYVGPSVDSHFPGTDYGLIRIDGSVDAVGQVLDNGGTYEITHAGNPPTGTYVCKTGSTTGTTCGRILDYDVTVNYAQGTVRGLIETDVCTQAGDSGGALFASGNEAVGTVSGGTTVGCSNSQFRSYFENASQALNAYGLTLE
ncbi:MAG: S1 family peptidase [Streptosporangiaceae bacterium]